LRTPDFSQQPVLGFKEIPRIGSYEPVESHHCWYQILVHENRYGPVVLLQFNRCAGSVKNQCVENMESTKYLS